ncbi:unnamed protein product [Pelagomonas calceolata]|uniref:N-acetyltransferase domain-containing protein n=1 Tax=Pelagomonas calceolata TaxID=35677 RepID=A0A8J2T080_9STRA|nr:unnamed protein product [Pelagomonas calceolata]
MAEAPPPRRQRITIGGPCQCKVNDRWLDARVDSVRTIEETEYFRILFKGGLRRYDGDYPKTDIRPAADTMEEEQPVEDDASSESDRPPAKCQACNGSHRRHTCGRGGWGSKTQKKQRSPPAPAPAQTRRKRARTGEPDEAAAPAPAPAPAEAAPPPPPSPAPPASAPENDDESDESTAAGAPVAPQLSAAEIYELLQSDDPDVVSRGIPLIGSLSLDEELRDLILSLRLRLNQSERRLGRANEEIARLRAERDARGRGRPPAPARLAPAPPPAPRQPARAALAAAPRPAPRRRPRVPAAAQRSEPPLEHWREFTEAQPETTRSSRRSRRVTSRLDNHLRETLDFQGEGQTREMQLWVAKTPAELAAARTLLTEGFTAPGRPPTSAVKDIIRSETRDFETVRFVCISRADAPLAPVSAAAVVTARPLRLGGYNDTDRLRVRLLCTKANVRQRGYAKFLLRNLARIAAQRGMPRTFVEAVRRDDDFWERCGFREISDAERVQLDNQLKRTSEQALFKNTVVVQAAASFEFHARLFQLRVGSNVIFVPIDSDERAQGTIVELDDESWQSCTLQTGGASERTTYDGTDVFDIRRVGTKTCPICSETRRHDEMNRQPCCPAYLCVICDAQLDKCYNCRTEKA